MVNGREHRAEDNTCQYTIGEGESGEEQRRMFTQGDQPRGVRLHLDLLRLLELFLCHRITREEMLSLLQGNAGWLKVSGDQWEIRTPKA